MKNLIGFFGKPGDTGSQCTKVHMVRNNSPACGVKLKSGTQFQFVGYLEKPHRWLECQRCTAILQKEINLNKEREN